MRLFRAPVCSVAALVLLAGAAVPGPTAQTFAAAVSATPGFAVDIPESVPSALPAHHRKTDQPLIFARVRDGIFSVDGMVGKVQLNYDVRAANFLYLFIPGVGTAVVALAPTADAIWHAAAFEGDELTLHAGGHTLNLTGIQSLVSDNGKRPPVVYVRMDRESWRLNRTPMMGFGKVAAAPYEWPGALPAQAVASADEPATASAPVPVPVNLLPGTVSYRVPAARLH